MARGDTLSSCESPLPSVASTAPCVTPALRCNSARRAVSPVVAAPVVWRSAPRDAARNTCSAITFTDSRFITVMSVSSGADSHDTSDAAVTGVFASVMPFVTVMPLRRNAARKAPVVKDAGSSTMYEYERWNTSVPMLPVTEMPLLLRANFSFAPRPATVRTAERTGMAVVAGSSTTSAAAPRVVGRIVTHTRFSFSDSAETRPA